MDPESRRIKLLEEQPWKEIILELDKYAFQKARRLYWPSASSQLHVLAKGTAPSDIAREAITRIFEGSRKWDPEKNPDVLQHLKSVVDSLISALIESAEVAEVRMNVAYSETDSSSESETGHLATTVESAPLHQAPPSPAIQAQRNEIRELVLAAVAGDDDLNLLVLCIEEGHTKRADIARELGITADEVTNLKKRLQRVIDAEFLARLRK